MTTTNTTSGRGASRQGSHRAARQESRLRSPLRDTPWRLTHNPMPPTEILTPEELAQVDEASLQIAEAIGIDFMYAPALDLWHQAGAEVDFANQHVRIPRGLLRELVAKAPSEFTLRARNPARNVRLGGNHIVFAQASGMPFVADLQRGRREGRLSDTIEAIKLVQMCNPIHLLSGNPVEPQDVPVRLRPLVRLNAFFHHSDKAVVAGAQNEHIAADCLAMTQAIFGDLDQPSVMAVVNANSPLRYDSGMLGGLMTYAAAAQPVVVTPFILAGAMSPISIAAALAQQNAEALAGIALMQLVRPGAPAIYGAFTTNTDMATGGPAFGTPEGAWALLAGAQLARRYGLPYRGSGSLNTSKMVDAQAAYETQMSLWPCVMGHTNLVLQAAGWLEGGLVFSFEKFVVDAEGLAMMQHFLKRPLINDEELALDFIREVGPGGHHFGTTHTLARYQTDFHRSSIADRQNIGTWQENGALDTAQRATLVWKDLLDHYVQPPLDIAKAEALQAIIDQPHRDN